ncbi:hypothetical protein HG531_009363 [Fusarium graminearum]|nr:hypothetical protein HG531_009363 [Fusarium graminearum]
MLQQSHEKRLIDLDCLLLHIEARFKQTANRVTWLGRVGACNINVRAESTNEVRFLCLLLILFHLISVTSVVSSNNTFNGCLSGCLDLADDPSDLTELLKGARSTSNEYKDGTSQRSHRALVEVLVILHGGQEVLQPAQSFAAKRRIKLVKEHNGDMITFRRHIPDAIKDIQQVFVVDKLREIGFNWLLLLVINDCLDDLLHTEGFAGARLAKYGDR